MITEYIRVSMGVAELAAFLGFGFATGFVVCWLIKR